MQGHAKSYLQQRIVAPRLLPLLKLLGASLNLGRIARARGSQDMEKNSFSQWVCLAWHFHRIELHVHDCMFMLGVFKIDGVVGSCVHEEIETSFESFGLRAGRTRRRVWRRSCGEVKEDALLTQANEFETRSASDWSFPGCLPSIDKKVPALLRSVAALSPPAPNPPVSRVGTAFRMSRLLCLHSINLNDVQLYSRIFLLASFQAAYSIWPCILQSAPSSDCLGYP